MTLREWGDYPEAMRAALRQATTAEGISVGPMEETDAHSLKAQLAKMCASVQRHGRPAWAARAAGEVWWRVVVEGDGSGLAWVRGERRPARKGLAVLEASVRRGVRA